MSTTVLVSGASGFVATHIIKQLLLKGYTVIGTVRSTEKGDYLKKSFQSDKFSYEIIKDIVSETASDGLVKEHPEATVFLHTASPLIFATTNVENDLLKPDVNGTKSALASIKKYGPQIERVAVTSSYVGMAELTVAQDPKNVIDESS